MSNIYLTFVSDVTKDYASNVANTFKVKPNLRLHGDRWKVSIASAMLPKMALFKSLQSMDQNLMEMYAKAEKVDNPPGMKKGYVYSGNLREWEKAGVARNGVEFLNLVKHQLEETMYATMYNNYKISANRWHALEWKHEGPEPELLLKHTSGTDKNHSIPILFKFAEAMRWMIHKKNVFTKLGPNLVHNYPNHTDLGSTLDNGESVKVHRNGWLHLSALSD